MVWLPPYYSILLGEDLKQENDLPAIAPTNRTKGDDTMVLSLVQIVASCGHSRSFVE